MTFWSVGLEAAQREILINRGLVQRFPWEIMLWGSEGNLPNVSETVTPPAKALREYKNTRKAAFKNLGDVAGIVTVEDTTKKLTNSEGKCKAVAVDRFSSWISISCHFML